MFLWRGIRDFLRPLQKKDRIGNVAVAVMGIHWPDIDEHLSTEGLLRGAPAPQKIIA